MGNENPRDAQFQGFAKLLSEELYPEFKALDYAVLMSGTIARAEARDREIKQAEENIHELIARRAYDLACHAIGHSGLVPLSADSVVEYVQSVPDLTEWLDESEPSQ